MLQKLFNPEWQITSKSFLLSSFLIGFSFSPTLTAEISRLELEFEESLPWKTASIFKQGIEQESNGAAYQEKQNFLLCQISPSASSTRDLGTRLFTSFISCIHYLLFHSSSCEFADNWLRTRSGSSCRNMMGNVNVLICNFDSRGFEKIDTQGDSFRG